ncbi:hypothetical protein DPEC_G00102960 [Dallia pectoralis]|uniref:Uncharacterized protein n=1 Tax=Dallia pectoralis TaxID=75939 RepID=A0ACC2GX38_DALPE|nr:hypothetical protein DPEC_G00102960 [Dallia pectoralis]
MCGKSPMMRGNHWLMAGVCGHGAVSPACPEGSTNGEEVRLFVDGVSKFYESRTHAAADAGCRKDARARALKALFSMVVFPRQNSSDAALPSSKSEPGQPVPN